MDFPIKNCDFPIKNGDYLLRALSETRTPQNLPMAAERLIIFPLKTRDFQHVPFYRPHFQPDP